MNNKEYKKVLEYVVSISLPIYVNVYMMHACITIISFYFTSYFAFLFLESRDLINL